MIALLSSLCKHEKENGVNTTTAAENPRQFFLFYFPSSFSSSFLSPFPPLSMTPSFSLNLPELKVDFIRPILSPLNSRLARLCRFVLRAGDNGSNYTGSMSVPQLQQRHRQAVLPRSPLPGPHPHAHSGESQSEGLHAVMQTQTSGDKMVFVHEVIERIRICWCLQFSLPLHSASISPSLNMLCGFSGICSNLVYWHC